LIFAPYQAFSERESIMIVGTLTVDLVAKTASFEGSMDKASGKARRTSREIQDSFNGMNFGEARGGLMLVDDLLGIHMPRHAAAFVSQIPGFAAAFNAMFPVAAAVVAIKAIDDAFDAAKRHKEELIQSANASMIAAAAHRQTRGCAPHHQFKTGKPDCIAPSRDPAEWHRYRDGGWQARSG
jgi:hypothetical protein